MTSCVVMGKVFNFKTILSLLFLTSFNLHAQMIVKLYPEYHGFEGCNAQKFTMFQKALNDESYYFSLEGFIYDPSTGVKDTQFLDLFNERNIPPLMAQLKEKIASNSNVNIFGLESAYAETMGRLTIKYMYALTRLQYLKKILELDRYTEYDFFPLQHNSWVFQTGEEILGAYSAIVSSSVPKLKDLISRGNPISYDFDNYVINFGQKDDSDHFFLINRTINYFDSSMKNLEILINESRKITDNFINSNFPVVLIAPFVMEDHMKFIYDDESFKDTFDLKNSHIDVIKDYIYYGHLVRNWFMVANLYKVIEAHPKIENLNFILGKNHMKSLMYFQEKNFIDPKIIKFEVQESCN